MQILKIHSYTEFLTNLNSYNNLIINISASWCKPCVSLKPQLEKFLSVINEKDIIYLKIDMETYEEFIEFQKYFNVSKIPYFAIMKEYNVIDTFVSGDFNIVSKKIFDHITLLKNNENITSKTTENFDITDDF